MCFNICIFNLLQTDELVCLSILFLLKTSSMVGTCEGVGDMFSRKTEDVNERNVNSIVESWNYLHQETKNTLNDDSDENSFFFFFYGCGDKC